MSPRLVCLVVLSGLAASLTSPALANDAEQTKARALIDRAVKAMGGVEAVKKQKHILGEDRGTFYGMGQAQPYEGRFALALPTRWRMEIVDVFTMVIDGDKGWMVVQGATIPLEAAAVKEQQLQSQSGYVSTLVPLLKPDKQYRLTSFGTDTIDGEECDGINVDRDGYRQVTLMFSRKTGLLKKVTSIVRDDQTGKEVADESIYSDYRKIGDLLAAHKVVIFRDGKKYVESETTKLEFPEKLDDALFKQE